MNKKVPFEIVEDKVSQMYSKELGDESLDDRILAIEDFIKSCGWEIDEYETFRNFGDLN